MAVHLAWDQACCDDVLPQITAIRGAANSLMIKVLEWHVRDYLQLLVARAKVPRCRCHGAG